MIAFLFIWNLVLTLLLVGLRSYQQEMSKQLLDLKVELAEVVAGLEALKSKYTELAGVIQRTASTVDVVYDRVKEWTQRW